MFIVVGFSNKHTKQDKDTSHSKGPNIWDIDPLDVNNISLVYKALHGLYGVHHVDTGLGAA